MTGLQAPPKATLPSRLIVRFLVLLLLLLVAGSVIWSAVTSQRIGLTETVSLTDITPEEELYSVNGTIINVEFGESGRTPVVFLHDADVAGSALWGGVTALLSDSYRAVRIDLPGFGLSERITTEGSDHTVASMAEVVSAVIGDRLLSSPVVVGVGLGGKVAAELAVSQPDKVRGLVLIDVDFWDSTTWAEIAQSLPFFGPAATYTLSAGGLLGVDMWAPNCDTGGWCPNAGQARARLQAVEVKNTTDSFRAYLRTLPSSLVPSDLGDITAPTVFIWSREGVVPGDSVDRFSEKLPEADVVEVSVWKTHLEQPSTVADAVAEVGG